MRTTAHGFSAGVAKLGALWATIFFNYIGNKPRFWCAAACICDNAFYPEQALDIGTLSCMTTAYVACRTL